MVAVKLSKTGGLVYSHCHYVAALYLDTGKLSAHASCIITCVYHYDPKSFLGKLFYDAFPTFMNFKHFVFLIDTHKMYRIFFYVIYLPFLVFTGWMDHFL